MNEEKIKSLILEYIRSLDKGKIRRRELYGRLGLKGTDYNEFKRILNGIEKSGELVRLKGRTFALPELGNVITGVFSASRHGGGFVRPQTGDSVYIRREHTAGAIPGDTVQARLIHKGHVGINRAGEIIKIVERTGRPIIGIYKLTGKTAYVIPQEKVFMENMLVTSGEELGAKDGEIVVCRAEVSAPAYTHPMCTVVEVLGSPDAPGMDVLIIAKKYDLPMRFSEEAIEESRRIPDDLSAEVIARRRDIRGQVTFTIDPIDARDFDDAVSISRRVDGGFDIGVHIADVAHYVRDGSALDKEAKARGMSCYLVDRVIPMLPERLSGELCSLRPKEDRLTKSVFAVLDSEGNILSSEITDTVIHSHMRLNYQQVQAFLDGTGDYEADLIPGEVREALTALSDLTDILIRRRSERGALDFELPETKVILDKDGKPKDIVKRTRLKSHRMIEELMLIANTVTAIDLGEVKAPFLYRSHATPDSEKLEVYGDIARSLGYDFKPSLAESQLYIQSFLASLTGKRHERVLNMLLLRSMKKAVYSPHNDGHYGLALPVYAHFTSPIRRYPDLIVHRQLDRYILGNGAGREHRDLEYYVTLGNHLTSREITTDQAERDSVKMKIAEFMERHLGEEFNGSVSGIIPIGFFVELDEYFVEGLVHVSSLDDDYYEIDEHGVAMVGKNKGRRFMIGDRLKVLVLRADKERGEVDFMVVEERKKRGSGEEPKVKKRKERR
jgi:ribonuclease R